MSLATPLHTGHFKTLRFLRFAKVAVFVTFYGLAAYSGYAQTSLNNLPVIKTFTDSLTNFEIDNLGKLYLVGARQQIKKLDNNYDSVGIFNELRRFGPLHSIDVSNPLKVLLYYKEFSTIQILDRFLNVRTTLDLRNTGILQATAITQSYDNNIWLFDELDGKVKKIDEAGRMLLESPDFRVVFDSPPQLIKLEDHNKFLYGYDASLGLLVMDYFGAYKNLIAFKGWNNLHGISQGIVASDSAGLVYYKPGSIEVKRQPLPPEILTALKIRVYNQQLYVLSASGKLTIYRLPG